eukprot:1160230-Pelagomonas_calceolata.AAC.11
MSGMRLNSQHIVHMQQGSHPKSQDESDHDAMKEATGLMHSTNTELAWDWGRLSVALLYLKQIEKHTCSPYK